MVKTEELKTEEPKKIKVLWMSDSPNAATGYGTVSRNVLKRLKSNPRYDVHVVAWQFMGQPAIVDGMKFYPPGQKMFGEDMLQEYLDKLQPDILVTLCDLFMLMYMTRPGFRLGKTKFMPYFACDGFPLPNGTENVLKMATLPIAMAKYGQQVTAHKELYPGSLDDWTLNDFANEIRPAFNSKLIYHGFDDKVFRPVNPKEKEALKESQGFGGKFVIGTVGRNQGRKYYVRLLQAFKLFMKRPQNKDSVLYMHTDPKDPQGTDLINSAKLLGIGDHIRFTDYHGFHLGVPDEKLSLFYNCFDVHTLSTTGEGFGLPILESMACGVPNVLPDYTTSRELIEGHGRLVKIDTTMTGTWMVQRGFCNVQDLCDQWQFYHDNREECVSDGMKAFDFSQQFTWDKLTFKWEEAIEECLGSLGGINL